MPTFTFSGFSASAIQSTGGSLTTGTSFMLDPNYDAAQALVFTVTDDDSTFTGSSASQLDANQTVSVSVTGSSTVLASGPVRLGLASTFTPPGTVTPVTLYEVWVGSTRVGYVANGQIVPGVAMSVTSAADSTTGVAYSSIASPTYNSTSNSNITGGTLDDRVLAGAGNDTVTTNAGNDSIDGGSGNDSLSSGDGNDTLVGGLNNDTLFGGNNDDVLTGGQGSDSLSGDAGNDIFLIPDDTGVDSVSGGTGTDTLNYAASAALGVNVVFTATGSGNHNFATLGTAGAFTGIEAVVGTGFADTINGASDASTGLSILGGAGNDALTGGGGADVIDGGADADTLTGNNGTDTLTGGTGADSLSGGAGADSLDGGSESDTIFGGTGNDTILGGAGNDSLSGDGNDDTFVIGNGFGNETISGGGGLDSLDFSTMTAGVVLTLSTTTTGSGTASAAGATLIFDTMDRYVLGNGADTVFGAGAADSLEGAGGNDSLSGAGGVDTLSGGAGDDTLSGGAGGDVLAGGIGMDYVDYSTSGAAVNINLGVSGQSGGDAAGDQLSGLDGVIGSGFNDTILGFDGEALTGADIYTNALFGGGGNDSMDGLAGSDSLFGGTDNDTVQGSAGNDTLSGDQGNDSVVGGADNDRVNGGDGNDTVSGDDGNDSVSGDAGADSISGGVGNDTISGGTGNDTISGGAGSDLFVLSFTGGQDTILDFNATLVNGRMVDQVSVTGLLDAQGNQVDWADATITADASGNAVVTFPGGERIVLLGVTPAQVTGQQALYQMGVPCFAAGTRIATPTGEVAVESLRAGDMVWTLDGGAAPVLWAGGRHLDGEALSGLPDLRPVVIRAGAFGLHDEVMVSPQHAILVDTKDGERLVRARHLAESGDGRARVARGKKQVDYHHLLLPRHAILRANGLLTESMYPGPMALTALGPAVRLEIAMALPWLAPALFGLADVAEVYGPTARPVARRGTFGLWAPSVRKAA